MPHKPSVSQLRVLWWLAAYPGIRIVERAIGTPLAGWSASWRSAAARQHMCHTIADLGAEFTGIAPGGPQDPALVTRPRWADEGGTPPLRRPTFRALAARRWITRVERAVRTDLDLVVDYRWQLSPEGRKTLFAHRHLLAKGVE